MWAQPSSEQGLRITFDSVLAERPVQAFKSLIDTGVSHSFVSQRVVMDNLNPVDAQHHGSLSLANDTLAKSPGITMRIHDYEAAVHFSALS